MGHIRRSMLLSDALADRYEVIFIMKNYSDGVAFVQNSGRQTEVIDVTDDDDETLISLCDRHAPQKVIFDLYANNYSLFFDYARSNRVKTIVFDIIGKCRGVPDVLINDSFVEEFTDYRQLSGRTALYTGPDYFLIDRPYSIPPIHTYVREIMVTMGGSDPAGLTGKILSSLVKINAPDCTINVVLGPAFSAHGEIDDLARSHDCITVYKNPLDFLELLSRQDIVITAAGRTLYECAYFGRPVIIVPSIDHETITAKAYAERTGSFNIGLWNDATSPYAIIDRVNSYRDYLFRKEIFNVSRKLIDGNGLKRVLRAIEAI